MADEFGSEGKVGIGKSPSPTNFFNAFRLTDVTKPFTSVSFLDSSSTLESDGTILVNVTGSGGGVGTDLTLTLADDNSLPEPSSSFALLLTALALLRFSRRHVQLCR